MGKSVKNSPFLICILVFCSLNSGIAGTSSKSIHSSRITGSISIDGIPDESDWKNAETVSDFTQFDPVEGVDPTEKSEVKILFDDNAL